MASTISGALGASGAGATVSYSGPSSGTVTADGSGNYSIPGLANGDYTLSVSKTGFFFKATSFIAPNYLGPTTGVVVNNASISGANFTAQATAATFRSAGTSGSAVTSLATSAWQSFAGNPIVVLVRGSTLPTSISDTATNVFVQDFQGTENGAPVTRYSVKASKGNASNILTVNFPSSSFEFMAAFELSNIPAGNIGYVAGDTATKGSGTFIDSNSLSTLAPAAFIFSVESANSNGQASTGRGMLNGTLDQTSASFSQNVGHGFALTGAQVGTVGMNLAATGTTITLVTTVYGIFPNGIRGNCGVGSATVGFSGPRSGSVTADLSGNYFIPFGSGTDIATWTITPSGTGLTFSPVSNTVVVSALNVDAVGPNFTATTTITSGPTYTVTDSTIVATWTTSGACESKMFAGAKAGLDNAIPASETTHFAVVAGLSPSTTYSCTVQSLTSVSAPQNVVTGPAKARFQLTSSTDMASRVPASGSGDTCFTFVSNDGKQYLTSDDGTGLTASGVGNMNIDVLTNPTTMAGTFINSFVNLGGNNTYDGQDSPAGANSTKKWGGPPIGIGGNLYAWMTRQALPGELFLQYRASILKSSDHGVTWANWKAPTVFSAGGAEPAPVFSFVYASSTFGWAGPIRYAADDGTLGYNTTGNQIDGGNAYVYQSVLPQGFTNFGLARIPRRLLNNFNGLTFEYWIGPASPTVADFVNDSNWSSSTGGMTTIYTAPAGNTNMDWPCITFIPRLNSYILTTFGANFIFAAAPTPAGPWTTIYNTATVFNGPCPLHSDIIANVAAQSLALRMTFSASPGANYHPQIASFTLSTSTYPVSGTCNIAGATISFTGTASGSVTADALGFYTIPNLANGNYTITPSMNGFSFTPASSSQTVSNADVTGVNFTGVSTLTVLHFDPVSNTWISGTAALATHAAQATPYFWVYSNQWTTGVSTQSASTQTVPYFELRSNSWITS